MNIDAACFCSYPGILHKLLTKISLMKAFYLLFFFVSIPVIHCLADPGDTTVVQTYTFDAQNNPETDYDSPGRRWFDMPADDGTEYQKVLMYYTLKCFDDGTAGGLGYPCGEWDYTTHTYLYDHTGTLDSNLVSHPQYLLNNQDFDSEEYITDPVFDTYQYTQFQTVIDEIISEEEFTVGGDSEVLSAAMLHDQQGRSQFLWTADELTAAGLDAGELDRMAFNWETPGADYSFVTIRLKEVGFDIVSEFENGGFTTVFESNLSGVNAGWNTLNFNQPFEWDGSSNLLIEVLYENPGDGLVHELAGESTVENSGVVAAGNDGYMRFDGGDFLDIPIEAFDALNEEITISLWMNGDADILPANTVLFGGYNDQGQRVINSHLPWGNSRIYWDCGQDGNGYDRIEKLSQESEFEGQWNHWAFTKNAVSGEMKIYLNGSLWHSGSDKFKTMETLMNFFIGMESNGQNYFFGDIDNFRIWSAELDEATIQEWMFKNLDNNHVNYSSLISEMRFDGDANEPELGSGPNGWEVTRNGNPQLIKYSSEEIFKNSELTVQRPQVKFLSGDYDSHQEEQTVSVEQLRNPVSLIEYAVDGYGIEELSVQYVWQDPWALTYAADGTVVDSTLVQQPIEIENSTLEYFEEPFEVINRFEIGRYITPYGIGLDLGDDGWTWVFDVTDYEPLLRDSVELQAGNWQELLDLKFVFIEGTPPRDVKRIENLWTGSFNLNSIASAVEDKQIEVQDGEEMFRLKARTSGHGFGTGDNCAEFCNNVHSVDVDGNEVYDWQIIQECADNPLFPQGGTWIYDRAGWCPGDKVTTQNLELTPFVSGNSFSVDYNTGYSNNGNYIFHGQLITYGAPNFATDVELKEIMAPSDWKIKSRINPMCDNPRIVIRNKGSETLTSCTIEFGLEGNMETFEWEGELEFLEEEEVMLTYSDASLYEGGEESSGVFEINLLAPNGSADENPSNNAGTSFFRKPPTFDMNDDNRLVISVYTNQAYHETSYTLYDQDGNVVFERDFDEPTTFHRDTLGLGQGCYQFHLKDSDDDGLSFFANNDGAGFASLRKVGGPTYINFQSNFGKEHIYHFYVETPFTSVEEKEKESLTVYPNPSRGIFNVEVWSGASPVDYSVINGMGKTVRSGKLESGIDNQIDLSESASGIYLLKVKMENGHTETKRIVVEK